MQVKDDGKIDVDDLVDKLPMKGASVNPLIGKDAPTDLKDGIIEVSFELPNIQATTKLDFC